MGPACKGSDSSRNLHSSGASGPRALIWPSKTELMIQRSGPLLCQVRSVRQRLIGTAWQAVPPARGFASCLHRFTKLYKSDANIFSCWNLPQNTLAFVQVNSDIQFFKGKKKKKNEKKKGKKSCCFLPKVDRIYQISFPGPDTSKNDS